MKNIWTKSLVISLLGVSVIGATTVTAASWTISQHTVSPKEKWSSYGRPNTKVTNSNKASFNGDVLPNFYGYKVRLINSNGRKTSEFTGLYKDQTTYGENNVGIPRHWYYADPRSHRLEPNYSTVKLHFSADLK